MNLWTIKNKLIFQWKVVIVYSILDVTIKNHMKFGKQNLSIVLIDLQVVKNN